jgi:glycosyltransferase involved in cell wall biosynthesis
MKQVCVISCPIDTYSGYGARSRDFVKAIYELKKDEWDIKILSQRWGVTPWGYINDHFQDWGFLNDLLLPNNQLTFQPDIWFQITVPNESQPVGKDFNCIVTAGIETTICDASWIDGCNRMNLVLASSQHAVNVFKNSSFEQRDQAGNTVRQIKLEKPVEILFEGVDLNKYFFTEDQDIPETDLVTDLDNIKEDFCFLFVGHWLQGGVGQDRKNVGLMVKMFLETFKDMKNKPALIMKTSGAGASIMDREEMLKKIDAIRSTVDSKDLPNIYLIHGELEDEDMNHLYNHGNVKTMISFTKGEGFGRPLLEFSLSKKPIIASGWSGHMDFLNPEFNVLVGGKLTNVDPSAVVQNMILAESQWFSIDESMAQDAMKQVFENYPKFQEQAKRQAHYSKTNFSFDKMKEKLATYLERIPKKAEIKLPTLKKIQLPTLKKQ